MSQIARSGGDKGAVSKIKTKQVLLDVAVDQIGKVGEAHVRLEDVLRDAGASVSSLYHHFGSMRGLLDEAQLVRFDADTGENVQRFRDRALQCRDAAEFRTLVITTTASVFSQERARNRSMVMNAFGSIFETPGYHEKVVSLENRNIAVLTEGLRHGKDQGFITTDIDPQALAVWVLGLTFSRVVPDILDDEAAGEGWVRITTTALLNLMGLDPEH